jgi:putative ABC transport system permease protein
MAIPLTYNTRNLRLRTGATVMTALGIALTISIAVLIMALLAGLEQAFVSSGDPRNVLVMRQGADSEMMSFVNHEQANTLKMLAGVVRNNRNEPTASGETSVVIALPRRNGTGEVNVTVRGTTAIGIEMRPKIKLVEGRWFTPGRREVVVSTSVNRRFADADIGDSMRFGKGSWTVVGMFDAGGTAHQSEIWGDTNLMGADFDRPGYSSVLLRAQDEAAAEALTRRVSEDQRLKLQGMIETVYWEQQTRSGMTIKFVGTIVAVIMAIGSCFAAMNTMYASVAYRVREIATLRTLGFSRPSILGSFVIESVLLSLLGGVTGIILMLPFNGLTTGTNNMTSFSEIIFAVRITPEVAISALAFALIMGVLGGLAPAWHAARQDLVSALRN